MNCLFGFQGTKVIFYFGYFRTVFNLEYATENLLRVTITTKYNTPLDYEKQVISRLNELQSNLCNKVTIFYNSCKIKFSFRCAGSAW